MMIIVAVPVLLILIYRSERLQAKFRHHYEKAEKALVLLESRNPSIAANWRETATAPPIFESKNNFALVSGCGTVTALKDGGGSVMMQDELFELEFPDALRLHRRVQVYTVWEK